MTEIVRLTRGLSRDAAQVDTLAGRVSALLRVCPVGTVVAGTTAARLHGLWLPPGADGPVEVIVHPEIARPAARSASRRIAVRARRQMLLPDEVTDLDGIAVTTESRTWLDLAARLPMIDLVSAGDSALRGDASSAEMAALLVRARHRRGVVRARTALPLLNARSRSRPESHLRYSIVEAGLPCPAVNAPIFNDCGEWLAEPDLSYEDVRLAIEYNGAVHADPRQMRRDINRELDVIGGNWFTITFGANQVFGRPDSIPALVRELRRRRLISPLSGALPH